MYHIKPESIQTFLDDKSIRLPRFQRKQTWKSDQNFKLAVSVFKDFPIGVTIINKQTLGGKTTRWLLDGRQRRHALQLMNGNPEILYDWAKKFIGFKPNDQPQEIEEKFWRKLENYLNDSDEAGFNEAREDAVRNGESEFYFDGKVYTIDSIQEETEFDGEFTEDDIEDQNDDDSVNKLNHEFHDSIWGNLKNLLFIITTVHKRTKAKSGFTSPFDFRKVIDNLPYSIEGGSELCGKRLRSFIDELVTFCDQESIELDWKAVNSFYNSRFKLSEGDAAKLKQEIMLKWEAIKNSLKVVDIIKSQLQEASLGIIETSGITSTDAQMIFTLINKEGTKLSAVEILSAKPAWNILVQNPSSAVTTEKKKLYDAINTEVESTVRWDYPATLYDRLNELNFLFPPLSYNDKNQLDKKLTLGFKILSGLLQKGIKKEDVDALSSNRSISWESDIDKICDNLNLMGKLLGQTSYFQELKNYRMTLMSLTSDAIALNFLFTCYFDFERKGKPLGSSAPAKNFVHNALILADRMVFEYATFKWRGSSDSRVSQNIAGQIGLQEKFKPLAQESWINLFKSINDNQIIEDSPLTFTVSKSIVYHVYAVLSSAEIGVDRFDVDHIIPQAMFDSASSIANTNVKHSVFNLCPLPSKGNKKKGKKRLKEIEDPWLIKQIEHYSKIPKREFEKYSKVQNWAELRETRRSIYETDFIEKRNSLFDE